MTVLHLVLEVPPYQPTAVRNTEFDVATSLPSEHYEHALSLLREHPAKYRLVELEEVVMKAAVTEVLAEN